MAYEQIIVEQADKIATVKLNRPEKLNAYTPKMGDELHDFFSKAADDKDINVVILTGAGRAFCSGADVTGFDSDVEARGKGEVNADLVTRRGVNLITSMSKFPKPLIAAINGPAVGIGCSLPLVADFRVASDAAKIGAIFARVGLIPEFGSTYTLPRLIGLPKACELVFTGKIIDAQEAKEIGLVNHVFPADIFEEETLKIARNITQMAPLALQLAKRGMYQGMDNTFETQVQYESFGLEYLFRSDDHAEGVKAFLQKRKPQFQGR